MRNISLTDPMYVDLPTQLQEKLRLSLENTEHLVMREIRCPFCNYLVDIVCSDTTEGHKIIHCKKCKRDYMISYAHFRTHGHKPIRHPSAKRRQSR